MGIEFHTGSINMTLIGAAHPGGKFPALVKTGEEDAQDY